MRKVKVIRNCKGFNQTFQITIIFLIKKYKKLGYIHEKVILSVGTMLELRYKYGIYINICKFYIKFS